MKKLILLAVAVLILGSVTVGDAQTTIVFKVAQASFVSTQVLDFYSTRAALASGAGREGNGIMKGIVGKPLVFAAVKGGATTLILLASQRLWHTGKHKTAIVLIVAMTAGSSAVVANNLKILHAGRVRS